jgi:lysophospholipase L1-like esterase
MTSSIERLTPHMAAYAEQFADSGTINWQPYLMYFHPRGHSSAVVNTDRLGFRYSEAGGRRYSVADHDGIPAVRVLAGSSTVFGIGASADRHTLASRMTARDPRGDAWMNFGGRSFNSVQELMLFALNRHLLPPVREIVLFSGFNNLGLARLPPSLRGDHGAFFLCRDFFSAMESAKAAGVQRWLKRRGARADEASGAEAPPALAEQIAYAVDLTLRHLSVWRALAADCGAKLTFVLQPLSGWVRETGSAEEEALFAELEARGGFMEAYGDILSPASFSAYADALARGAKAMDVGFVNLPPLITAAIAPERWLFVDRIHFTDDGHDFVAGLLLDALGTETESSEATPSRRATP